MAQYTAEVFQWTGTFYNAQYNTSHTATFDDNDAAFQGGADADESISIDGGAFQSSDHQPYSINIPFTDTSGTSHVENFNFFLTDGNWYFIPGPGSAFTVGATLGSYQSYTVGWDYADIICLARGTLIETTDGQVPVEDLDRGDLIRLGDGSLAPLRLALSRRVSSYELARHDGLRPVRITAGALGGGLPLRDLLVSRQHRMVVRSPIVRRMFGQDEVLVAAIRLCAIPGVFLDRSVNEVEYFHLVLDLHKVILAEGAPTESLYFGASAIASLTPAARAEIETLFGTKITTGKQTQAARLIPPLPRQNLLIRRHLESRQGLVSA